VTLAYSFYFRIHPVVDAKAYDNIAQNLLTGNGFIENADINIIFDRAITRVGPLYQFVLAGIYTIFGHNFEPVWFLQALLHVASAYFVYLTTKIIFTENEKKEKIALISTAIFAFFPDFIEISAMLMTETVYIFFWCLMIWYFFKIISEMGQNKKITLKVFGLGVVSGLAVLARPPVLFVLPAIFVYFLARKKYVLSVIFFLTLALVFMPWTVRNYMVYQKVMPVGAAGAWNFWIGNHVGGTGEQEETPEMREYLEKYGVISLQDESVRQFKKFVAEHPLILRLTIGA
jgi:4-amino-4-deoxy-L-arabinose transferase-like glycosyltransferase